MLNGLSLFSGIGGLDVALSRYVRPIAYCEIDPYCQGVLLSKMVSRELCNAPIWTDITTLESTFMPLVDIIYGGFPCQDISVAGRGKGLEGERSGLFFEIVRLAKEIKPKFIFLENVSAITGRGGLRVVREITEMGYDCRWCVISAASVGALHKRERWFLLGHSSSKGTNGYTKREKETFPLPGNSSDIISNTRCECERILQGRGEEKGASLHITGCSRIWETEPPVGRLADGVFNRVDKLRALGNAVVPQQAKEAFEILMGYK